MKNIILYATLLILILILLVASPIKKTSKGDIILEGYINKYNLVSMQDRMDYTNGPKPDRPDLAAEREFIMTLNPALGRPTQENLFPILERVRKKDKKLVKNVENINMWESRGPNNVGGRTRSIMIDVSDPSGNTVWAGSVSGGLWKTTNFHAADAVWHRVDDFLPGLSISKIVQDPNNPDRMYFSTGESTREIFGGGISAFTGFGLWKSMDGGTTWNVLSDNFGAANFGYDLEIDGKGELYFATANGLYRYYNDDKNIRYVLGKDNDNAQGNALTISDIELGTDGTKYAATHGNKGTAGRDFVSGQIFRSEGINAGQINNWVDITPQPSIGYFRIEIDVSPSNPNRLIALCEEIDDSNVLHIYVSNDKGATWISQKTPTIVDGESDSLKRPIFTRGQSSYNLIARFDPSNDNVIYIGGIDLLRSIDAGASWEQITAWNIGTNETNAGFTESNVVHADQHVIEFFSNDPSRAIFANDGGIYYSNNLNVQNQKPDFSEKNNGYIVTQFYACATEQDPDDTFFLAGAQDNGTRAFFDSGINDEVTWFGGDGAYCFFSARNDVSIFSSQFANYYSWDPGQSIFTTIIDNASSGRFINPADYDPSQNILIASKSRDDIYIVQDADSPNPKVDSLSFSFLFTPNSVIISPYNTSKDDYTIYVSSFCTNPTRACLYKITHALGINPVVTNISRRQLPFGYISSIQLGETEETIAVTLSNYGVESVWLTTDSGVTWRSKEGNLPDIPVRWALFNPNNYNNVYIATELGIWSTDNINADAVTWYTYNDGLANVRVDMLRLRNHDNLLLAATHGRGLFTRTLCSFSDIEKETNLQVCSGSSNGFIRLDTDNSYSYQWADGNILSSRENLPFGLYTVTISNSDGCTESRSYEIEEFPSIMIDNEEIFNVSCNNGADGTIKIEASSDQGALQFAWSSGQVSNFIAVRAGSYMITITDPNGCTHTRTYEVSEPGPLTADFDQMIDSTTDVRAVGQGGTPPYNYNWSDGQEGETALNLNAGEITVTITDNNGCSIVESVEVSITSSTIDPEILTYVTIFPNPTSGVLHIDINTEMGFKKMDIIDIKGSIVFSSEIVSGFKSMTYDISLLDSGYYLVKLSRENRSATLPLIVQ
ncbi:MAG: T9SS type A sorting domain-containing protein [Saprospiraceae bacterium]